MDNPDLPSRAKIAAMPLVRHADLDGRSCFVGRKLAAEEMSVSPGTINRGWAALKAAGYLEILPHDSRRRAHGAIKVLKFPPRSRARTEAGEDTGSTGIRQPAHQLSRTYTGNRRAEPTGSSSSEDMGGEEVCDSCKSRPATRFVRVSDDSSRGFFDRPLCDECAQWL
jgi:hypothetical protein